MNESLMIVVTVVIAALVIGVPSYLCIQGYRRFKDWANTCVGPLFDEGQRVSAIERNRPVTQYAVAGFFNIGLEWSQTIYVDESNIDAVRDLLARTAAASYKISLKSIFGALYGPVMTWINHSSARRKLAKHAKEFGNTRGV